MNLSRLSHSYVIEGIWRILNMVLEVVDHSFLRYVLGEQLKHLGQKVNKWLHTMLNVCFTGNKILKIWRQSKIITILKPGKDSAIPKNYIPISLLCHTYKLYERMILNRIAPVAEQRLIKEQVGFRTGKSYTSQLLNPTQDYRCSFRRPICC